MRLKDLTIKLKDLQPQTVLAILIVNSYLQLQYPAYEHTITSINDGKHMDGSLHYKGCAVDFRTHDYFIQVKDVKDQRQSLLFSLRDNIKNILGGDFDVIIEDPNGPNEHMHVEYQPKIVS